jgi:NTE family protein
VQQPVVRAELTIDQLDDPLFPRKGYYFNAVNQLSFGGTDNSFDDVHGKACGRAATGAIR